MCAQRSIRNKVFKFYRIFQFGDKLLSTIKFSNNFKIQNILIKVAGVTKNVTQFPFKISEEGGEFSWTIHLL